MSVNLYLSKLTDAENLINQKNLTLRYFIEGYFTKFYNTVDFLVANRNIVNASAVSNEKIQDILDLYKNLEKSDPDINYIYSGYSDGSLLINDYKPPKGYNSVIRPWYQAALNSSPFTTNGIPYREITTREWLFSISKTLLDKEGNITGVVAIDSSISKIAEILKKRNSPYNTLYSFLINRDGLVLIHHNEEYLNRNFQDILGFEISFPDENGRINYKKNGIKKLGYYRRIDKVGWVIITVVDKKEIVAQVILKMLFILLAVGLIAIALGWYLSNTLVKHFLSPLRTLQGRVNVILSGQEKGFSHYQYPNNEIGDIAADIEKLAENELHLQNMKLMDANRKLEQLSFVDQLTGLYNRRKMNEALESEWERVERYKGTFSLMMFDIDWFKRINDTYGHQTGDLVLKSISLLTQRLVRKTDIVSRWGGEEFLILYPETSMTVALELAKRMLSTIRKYQFPESISLTVSIGLCEYIPGSSVDKIIEIADKRLYTAKQSGRDCLVAEDAPVGNRAE